MCGVGSSNILGRSPVVLKQCLTNQNMQTVHSDERSPIFVLINSAQQNIKHQTSSRDWSCPMKLWASFFFVQTNNSAKWKFKHHQSLKRVILPGESSNITCLHADRLCSVKLKTHLHQLFNVVQWNLKNHPGLLHLRLIATSSKSSRTGAAVIRSSN